jgi:putative Holliday junction resolvase
MKYIGIDFGTKKVGVALSDAEGRVAFPKAVLKNDSKLINQLVDFIENENVEEIVIGESRDFSGKENKVMDNIKWFVEALEEKINIKIIFEPEFYTSIQASRTTGKTDMEDAQAAALILQSFLDKRNN